VSYRPPIDLTVVAWLAGIAELSGVDVSTSMLSEVKGIGFIRVSLVGGAPDGAVPLRQGVVTCSCYARRMNSSKPAWGQAAHIADTVLDACYGTNVARTVQPRGESGAGSWPTVDVCSVRPMTEPRRITGDPDALARYDIDVEFVTMSTTWAAAV
jgi:hypothetical protein